MIQHHYINSNKSIQLPVVMVKSWSNPLTVRLNKAAKPNKSKDIGRVAIKYMNVESLPRGIEWVSKKISSA